MSSIAHPDGAWSFDVLEAIAIDGDTVRTTVDLGFGAAFRFDLRIMGINAPELRFRGGPEAKARLAMLLLLGPLVVTTHRSAGGSDRRSFARWVGSIRLFGGTDGDVDIGDLMVAAGHARRVITSQ